MGFSGWLLLNEAGRSAKITVAQGLEVPIEKAAGDTTKMANEEDIKNMARQGLIAYHQSLDPQGWRFLKARYDFHVERVSDYWDALTLTIKIVPLTPKGGEEEMASPDDPAYDYYQRSGGKTGKTLYRSPKDAIQEIPNDPAYGYRGMAWEEWQSINKIGQVKSRGHYNIGQEDYTMFGYDPETGLHYAHGFAPLQYKVGLRKPGVVIAVPRKFLLTHKDDPTNIPQSELGLKGPLDKQHIAHVWLMTLNKASKKQGYMELRFKWVPDWDDRKYKDPRQGYFVLDLKKPRLGSAMLSGGVEYAIRQLF